MKQQSITAAVFSILLVTSLAAPGARAETWTYVRTAEPIVFLEGHATPASSWTSIAFAEDASWTRSDAGFGIGYGDDDDATVLGDMSGNYLTVYVRYHFTAGPEAAGLVGLQLEALFDDGFAAQLNGEEIARSHLPAGALTADTAATSHEAADGAETFFIDPGLLVEGGNVFSVEVHNTSLSSSDLSFIPTLSGYNEPPVDARITRGPYLQNVTRSSIVVVWETDNPVMSEVRYGTTTDMEQAAGDLTPKTRHEIALEGLEPATDYYYRVESADPPSDRGLFTTVVNTADPFRIAVYGDTRSNHDDHRDVMDRVVLEAPNLALLNGDLVGSGDDEGLWVTFFDVEQAVLMTFPLYPCLGNHEQSGDLYVEYFVLPENSPSAERYYWVRYATAAVIAIDLYTNSFNTSSDQYAWIEETLQAASDNPGIRHILIELHHGPYHSGSHGSNASVRSDLAPLFEAHGVDIVFSGHDHCYERGTVGGVKYVVSGGGGAPLYSIDGDWWTEESESVLHYCILDIHGPRLEFTAKRLDGSTLDHFILGEDVNECTGPADCDGEAHEDCDDGELGGWECVLGGCIWNCVAEEPPPPDEDGEEIPEPPDGASPDIAESADSPPDAAADDDIAAPDPPDDGSPDGGGDAGTGEHTMGGGCGCGFAA
ncbi:MAG: metallophosphoesterase family protein [Pseudomonadota bacterium]